MSTGITSPTGGGDASGGRPRVSVFMPVYNQEAYVADALDSVLAQGYRDFQIAVLDDGSRDATPDIVRDYARRHGERVRAAYHPENRGITGTCNDLLPLCTGHYVAFFAGDDLWMPDKLERQVALMDADPRMVMSYHDVEVFSADQTLGYKNSGPGSSRPAAGDSRAVLRALIRETCDFLGGVSVMVRRDAMPAEGYDERVATTAELLMWADILSAQDDATVGFIPEVLARYRRHDGNVTNTAAPSTEYLTIMDAVQARHPWLAPQCRTARAKTLSDLGLRLIMGGHRREGLAAFARAYRASPRAPLIQLRMLARFAARRADRLRLRAAGTGR